jgi:superfamily II DNA or RNA helicase
MGKTRVASMLVGRWLADGLDSILFTNRRLLIDQLSDMMNKAGIPHGLRAAGHHPEHHHPFQIASLPTEHSRVVKAKTWETTPAKRVLVDEAHLHTNNMAQRIIGLYMEQGASVVYLTATPIGMGDVADELIQPSSLAEGRAHGALVLARHFGPDEPDLKQIGSVTWNDDSDKTKSRRLVGSVDEHGEPDVKLVKLYGRVYANWKTLNPDGKPTILFAPGVKESVWFAQQFAARGVRAAHIDGEDVWVDGEFLRSSRATREEVLGESRTGTIGVLCNRFVLREGIDAPWLAHGILATVFGSLQSYLQSGGRLLRAHPGLETVTIQDHGGNWYRHGSLNAERTWNLDFTANTLAGLREDRMREKLDAEPFRCPQCAMILATRRCLNCGYVVPVGVKSRPVVTSEGELKEQRGDIFPPRRRRTQRDTVKNWTTAWFRAYQAGMTFRQAETLFAREHYYYPERNLALMPKAHGDWWRRVREVENDELIGPVPATVAGWRAKKENPEPATLRVEGEEDF